MTPKQEDDLLEQGQEEYYENSEPTMEDIVGNRAFELGEI